MGVDDRELKRYHKRIRAYQDRVTKESVVEVDRVGEEFITIIRSRLSGPSPGKRGGPPGMVTGEYRDSWMWDDKKKIAFTRHPAALRLEYGFVGEDSMGRHYTDPARPHIRPTVRDTQRTLSQRIKRILRFR